MNDWSNGWIFWILGALFIVFGVYSRLRLRKLKQSEHTVLGEIIRYEEMPDTGLERGSTGFKYHPVVRFQTSTGIVEHLARSGSSMRSQTTGQQVDVHYDPEDPTLFEVLNDQDALRKQTLPLAVGVGFVAIGVALLFI